MPSDLIPHWTFDNITLGLLALLLAFASLAFGGVEASGQLVIIAIVAVLTLVVLIRPAFDPGFEIAPRWIWLPAWLLVGIAALQLVPLPTPIVGWLAPNRVATVASAHGAAPIPGTLTLSISPLDTRHSLRLALVATFVLMATTAYTRNRDQLEKLLTIVFAVGCIAALLCLAQIITGATKLYWLVDPGPTGMLTAGSFVNHSHFAQFVNLAIGAGAGLLLMRIERAERQRRGRESARGSLSYLLRRQTWILFGLAVSVFAVCLSLSRNGILSIAISLAVVGSLLGMQQRGSWRLWLAAVIPLGVFSLLIAFGLDDFYERLATVQQANQYRDRWELLSASLTAGTQSPYLGTGLGSFALAFPAYDTTHSAAAAIYADNDYAQMFVEAGVVGILLVVISVAIIVRYIVHEIRTDGSSASQAVYGLMAGLLAVAIHSFTDFGQRIPGVFLLTVTCCGLLAALPSLQHQSAMHNSAPPLTSTTVPFRRRVLSIASASAAALVLVWMLYDAYAHYQAEAWWSVARMQEERLRANNWKGNPDEYRILLTTTENSLTCEPDNVELQFWLNSFRWMSVIHTPVPVGSQEALLAQIKPIAARIADELAMIRQACPVYHQPYILEGQLRSFALDDQEAAGRLLAQAAPLAKSDPQAQFAYGEWAARNGVSDVALRQLSTAVAIDKSYFSSACCLIIDELRDTKTPCDWAAGDLDRSLTLSRIFSERDAYRELAERMSTQANRLLVEHAADGSASSDQLAGLAQVAASTGDFDKSVRLYREALAQHYDQFDWRLQLATSLQQLGQVDAALRELRICLRLRPHNLQVRTLVEQISKAPTRATLSEQSR